MTYFEWIETKKSEPEPTERHQNHHIIPRSVGGSNDASNRIKLSYEDHWLAHQMLAELYPDNKYLQAVGKQSKEDFVKRCEAQAKSTFGGWDISKKVCSNQWVCNWDKELRDMYTKENKEAYKQYRKECQLRKEQIELERAELEKKKHELIDEKIYLNSQLNLTFKEWLENKDKGIKEKRGFTHTEEFYKNHPDYKPGKYTSAKLVEQYKNM